MVTQYNDYAVKRLVTATALRFGASAFKIHPSHADVLADKLADSVKINSDGSISGAAGGNLQDVIDSTKASDEGFARLFMDFSAPQSSNPKKLSREQLDRLSPLQLLAYANSGGAA